MDGVLRALSDRTFFGLWKTEQEDQSMAMTEPIRSKTQVRALANYCLRHEQLRNHCLIVLGIHTALRVGDLLRLTWDDVYDFGPGRVRESIALAEEKTGKTKIIALNKNAIHALTLYATEAAKRGRFLIENPRTKKPISRIQVYRIIRGTAEALELPCRVSCHSLRKTFGYHAWKNGVSPAIIMEIYNHSSFAVTKRYLGVTQDDKNEVYMRLDFSL
jgi:integrase